MWTFSFEDESSNIGTVRALFLRRRSEEEE